MSFQNNVKKSFDMARSDIQRLKMSIKELKDKQKELEKMIADLKKKK